MKPSRETQVTPELVGPILTANSQSGTTGGLPQPWETPCTCETRAARLARIGSAVAGLERVAPSADFAATFRQRLEREGRFEPESRLDRWRRIWSAWQARFIAKEGWRLRH